MSAVARDICTDCGRVLAMSHLFRCGRHCDGDFVPVQLCIDCLYAVNAYLQRDLIEAAYA